MKNKVGLLAIVLGIWSLPVIGLAQEKTFEKNVKQIAVSLKKNTISEKEMLKIKVDSLNVLIENNTLTEEAAQKFKEQFAAESSSRIEQNAIMYKDSLTNLVQNQVEESLSNTSLKEDELENDVLNTDTLIIGRKNSGIHKKGTTINSSARRNQFQLLFAYGASNLATDGAFANSDIRYVPSNFIQWGFTVKSRLFKNKSLLYLRYGFAFEYNNLKPTDGRFFEQQANGQVEIVKTDHYLDKSRLAIRSVQIPLYLEFDFSKPTINQKTGRKYFNSDQTWKFGLGGFVNFNKRQNFQVYHYAEDGTGYRVKEYSDLSINKVRGGLGAYVGNGNWSVFTQYELTPMFKHNDVKQNMWSLGLRVDL